MPCAVAGAPASASDASGATEPAIAGDVTRSGAAGDCAPQPDATAHRTACKTTWPLSWARPASGPSRELVLERIGLPRTRLYGES